MKKTYIKPSVEVVCLELENMIANSVTGVSGLDGLSVSNEDFGGGAADAKGRGNADDFGDLW